ncbi:MAG: glycerol-3-phosphate 1-O-acyltransferase PlsY [Armatimonadota bacterium]|jgi:glycerol-3-phosphate acyltransferase PlsY
MTYLALLACYLMGAIPFGLIVGKLAKGIDIRDFGSGNIGFTNVLRTLGPGPGFVVMFFDVAKGFAAVALCRAMGMNDYLIVAGGLLSIFGHSYSIFLKFSGGRSVATSLGVIAGLTPAIAAIAFGVWLVLVGLTRIVSMSSMVAAVSVPAMMFLWRSQHVPVAYKIVGVLATLLIIVKHKPNIIRLMNGTEARLGQKVKLDQNESVDKDE